MSLFFVFWFVFFPDKMPRLDLFEAIFQARKKASRFLNKAAIVVRGLPVSVNHI